MIGWIRHRLRGTVPALGAVLLIALLAADQVVAGLHDADHPFHGHQSLCDVFLGAQLQAPGAVTAAVVVAPVVVHAAVAAVSGPVLAVRHHAPQQPRAPPPAPSTI